MKKLIIFSAMALTVGMFIYSCEKEEIKVEDNNSQQKGDSINAKRGGPFINPIEIPRMYVWDDKGRLDCSKAGFGCIVHERASVFSESNEKKSNGKGLNGSIIQLERLMSIGDADLLEYFTYNDLSNEFPSLHSEDDIDIRSGNYKLKFEFPYLFVLDNNNNIEIIHNYERFVNDGHIQNLARRIGGGYNKKIEVNTNPGASWKCVLDGDNCKVSRFAYRTEWLIDNPQYLFLPKNEQIRNTSSKRNDNNTKTIIFIETTSGKDFGVEY